MAHHHLTLLLLFSFSFCFSAFTLKQIHYRTLATSRSPGSSVTPQSLPTRAHRTSTMQLSVARQTGFLTDIEGNFDYLKRYVSISTVIYWEEDQKDGGQIGEGGRLGLRCRYTYIYCYMPCMVAFMFVRTHVCLYTCMRVHMSILILPAHCSTFYFTKSQK